jgi:hypothetical protein
LQSLLPVIHVPGTVPPSGAVSTFPGLVPGCLLGTFGTPSPGCPAFPTTSDRSRLISPRDTKQPRKTEFISRSNVNRAWHRLIGVNVNCQSPWSVQNAAISLPSGSKPTCK